MLVKCGFNHICVMAGVCALNEEYHVGDFFIPLDHINFNSANPQNGPNEDSWGKRFYDCSNVYHHEYVNKAVQIAEKICSSK